MADIPQWRRKIPTARARTPLLTEPEHESRPPSALGLTHPPTPKRGLRPKLSSYLSHNGPFGNTTRPESGAVLDEPAMSSFPSWAVEDPFPNPSADQLIDSLMSRLMSSPYDALDPRFNSVLLQVFEAYRSMTEERDNLQEKLNKEAEDRFAEQTALQRAELSWEEDRESYKAEVKRLELIIAQGKRGVADVALARQGSLIRKKFGESQDEFGKDDGKETVIEFLEKTKRLEDPAWDSQRATMKTRAASPSAKMTSLSRSLTKKASMTSIHADLPFGTPPPNLPGTSFLQTTYQEDQATKSEKQKAYHNASAATETRPSLSDDTLSTFSCAGDLLPDEIVDSSPSVGNTLGASVVEDDVADIRQLALAISRRRGVSEESVMPKLIQLFNEQAPIDKPSRFGQRGPSLPLPKPAAQLKNSPGALVRKPSHLKGFLNRLRPQLSVETSPSADRRFSFEVGDDVDPIIGHQKSAALASNRQGPLRKNVSPSSLSETARKNEAGVAPLKLSPIDHSPPTSIVGTESRRSSKIPSPTYSAAVLAKPRQEREESMSSLLTAIKHPESPANRSGSIASSVYSTPSASGSGARKRQMSSDVSYRDSAMHASTWQSSGPPMSPRGQAIAAATRAASLSSGRSSGSAVDRGSPYQEKRFTRGGGSARAWAATMPIRKHTNDGMSENIRPFVYPGSVVDDDDGTCAPSS